MNDLSNSLSPKGRSRREQIIKKAVQEFSLRGYHATSVADILEGLDIARGTFYQYFANKKTIFEEILSDLLSKIEAQILVIDIDNQELPPTEQMRRNFERVIRIIFQDKSLARILLITDSCTDPDFDRRLKDFYKRLHHMISGSLDYGKKINLIRDVEPEAAADFILGSTKEVIHQTIVRDNRSRSPEELSVLMMNYLTVGFLKTNA